MERYESTNEWKIQNIYTPTLIDKSVNIDIDLNVENSCYVIWSGRGSGNTGLIIQSILRWVQSIQNQNNEKQFYALICCGNKYAAMQTTQFTKALMNTMKIKSITVSSHVNYPSPAISLASGNIVITSPEYMNRVIMAASNMPLCVVLDDVKSISDIIISADAIDGSLEKLERFIKNSSTMIISTNVNSTIAINEWRFNKSVVCWQNTMNFGTKQPKTMPLDEFKHQAKLISKQNKTIFIGTHESLIQARKWVTSAMKSNCFSTSKCKMLMATDKTFQPPSLLAMGGNNGNQTTIEYSKIIKFVMNPFLCIDKYDVIFIGIVGLSCYRQNNVPTNIFMMDDSISSTSILKSFIGDNSAILNTNVYALGKIKKIIYKHPHDV